MRVLLLGGTGEARDLAALLVGDGVDVVSSLAGRVRSPRLPVGGVRVGGFGGEAGLRDALDGYDAVVDATHPFARAISASAATACAATGTPLLRLARPGWSDLPGAGRWTWVGSHDEAAGVAARHDGGTVFLTTGRQALDPFLGLRDVLVRVVEPVDVDLPPRWTVLRSRGPYDVAGETGLMTTYDVRVLVTKDSGGDLTRAKLDAADGLGVDVVVVRRPVGPAGVPEVSDVAGARAWLRARAR